MNEGEEVRKGKSVFRSVILLMAVVFAVMAGNTGIYAAQVGETNGNDTTEIVNPTVTPEPDITITPEAIDYKTSAQVTALLPTVSA